MSNPFSFDDDLDASIDLTPLIDTVFMLLIFFIMATTFSKPVLEVALQNAEGAAVKEAAQEPLVISIASDGRFFLGATEASLAEIEGALANGNAKQPVVYNVDKSAPFGPFVQTVDLAKKYGRNNIAINTGGNEKSPYPAE